MMHAVPHVLMIVLLSHPVANYHTPAIGTAPTIDTSLRFSNAEDCYLTKRHVEDALDSKQVKAVVDCVPLRASHNMLSRR